MLWDTLDFNIRIFISDTCKCLLVFKVPFFSYVFSAVNIGTDMLELDCHITKDEQVVVSHDANLKRSTGINVNVSDLKYSVSKNKLISLYLGVIFLRQKRARCHYNK